MKNQCKQLSLFETFDECNQLLLNNKPKLLRLLDEYLDLKSLIPFSFYTSYYNALGCHRKYSLWSMLSIFLLQKIFGIPTIALLRIFLQFSKELREFCGIESVPDDAQFTRFKQDFVPQLEKMFHELVDLTEPICKRIDKNLASMLIYDTTGIETYVTENNDKFLNKIIRQVKASNKGKSNDHIHNIAYSKMPKVSSVNDEIRRMYANGKFCYAYKFGILTNGLGIVRDITCFDRKFKAENPELELEIMEDNPEEEKTVDDSKSLKPVIERTIHQFKEPMACGNPKTRNLATIKSDMLLAGITQLITVILADNMNKHELIRSLRPLIA